ncbi:P-loop NTPase fold protein [Shewanella sp. 10N.261.52.F9]|uniref:P-loop NTPase fold protein n=1 Tax=Shewanella sp. 10N.261.52.F9 TaxID=3229684 RepID=UPI00355316C3
MTQLSEVITSLLDDRSFPPMVRLDGQWGVGKTYFVEKDLRPYLKEKGRKTIFFSLTGISSLNDFRDKLISSIYFSEGIDEGAFKGLANNALTVIEKASDNGGLISSLLKGSAGVAKHTLLAKVNNVIVILDDLERVDDGKLEKAIVGECLQLINDNNLEFIFIINSEKSSIDGQMLEKAFSDRVYFERSPLEVVNIAFGQYNHFDCYQSNLIELITKYKFSNLRILKRASNRLNHIYQLIKGEEEQDFQSSMEVLISQVITISYLYYACNKTVDEISSGLDYTRNIRLPDDKSEDEFEPYRTIYIPTIPLIEYCCGKQHTVPKIEFVGKIFSKPCPIDRFMFARPYQLDLATFEDLLSQTTNYLFHQKDVLLVKWFQACENFRYLLENNFVSGDVDDFLNQLEKLANEKIFDGKELDTRSHNFKLTTNRINELYQIHKDNWTVKNDISIKNSLYIRAKESWANVDQEIYQNHRSTPFIKLFSADEWIEAIDNWSAQDIGLFSNYLFEAYRSTNIASFFKEDISTMRILIEKLSKQINKMDAGQPKGSRVLIVKALNYGLEKMSSNEDYSAH